MRKTRPKETECLSFDVVLHYWCAYVPLIFIIHNKINPRKFNVN